MVNKLYRRLGFVQGVYTLLTAVWALADIDSFMKVTGPKTDIWLVKTVALLLIPIAICFLATRYLKRDHWLIIIVGITSSAGLAFIDFYYTANGTIRRIYQGDGYLQVLFLTCWIWLFIMRKKIRAQAD